MKILISLYSKKNIYKLAKFSYYLNSLKELQKKGIETRYFYKENTTLKLEKKDIELLKKENIHIYPYDKIQDIILLIKDLNKESIIFNTFEEQQIQNLNKLRELVGQKTTPQYKLFNDKKLQRTLINEYPETIVNHKSFKNETPSKTILKIIQEPPRINFPYIIKPSNGIASKGVSIVNNTQEALLAIQNLQNAQENLLKNQINNTKILVEEYIDGEMYTIDYRINENQQIIITKPVKIFLGQDIGINDFCNTLRIINKKTDNLDKDMNLDKFIKKTVKGYNLKNTFIHHEFKINSKGEYKTIEINGRIGGFRTDMYKLGYGINLLSLPFLNQQNKKLELKNNVGVFAIYPNRNRVFEGYNEEILNKIYTLKSFHRINKGKLKQGEQIGFAKNGYSKVGSIVLKNNDNSQFKKDINYIEDKYFDILK